MLAKKPATLDFLVVARTGSGPYPHPVEVAVHPDGPRTILAFSIGPHAANAGGLVTIDRVLDVERTGLDPSFTLEFDAAELHWLVPHLARLAAGDDADIAAAYRERHGKPPATMAIARPAFP